MNVNKENFRGFNLAVHPLIVDQPKLKVSASVTCSPEVRDMFNAYLLDMFGLTPTYIFASGMRTVFMSPFGAAELRKVGVLAVGVPAGDVVRVGPPRANSPEAIRFQRNFIHGY